MDPERGERLLAYVARGLSRADQLLDAVQGKMFQLQEHQDLWEGLKQARKASGAWPTERELSSIMQAEWARKGYSQLVVEAYLQVVVKVFQVEVTEATWTDVQEVVVRSLGAEIGATASTATPKDLAKKVSEINGTLSGLEAPSYYKEEGFQDFLSNEYLDRTKEELEAPDLRPRFLLGFPSLDVEIGGLLPGELMILMASSGVGKSQLALNIAFNAISRGENVLYFDLEWTETEIRNRLYALITGNPTKTFARSEVFNHFSPSLRVWTNGSHGRLIYRKCIPMITTTTKIGHLIEEAKKERRIDVVIVDYGERLSPARMTDTRRFNEESVFEELQALGALHNLPVISPTQANIAALARLMEKENPTPPTLADLAECKAKARGATAVLALYQTKPDVALGRIRVNIPKNRKGESNKVCLFERQFEIARMVECMDSEYGPPAPTLSKSAEVSLPALRVPEARKESVPPPFPDFPGVAAVPVLVGAAPMEMPAKSSSKKYRGFYT